MLLEKYATANGMFEFRMRAVPFYENWHREEGDWCYDAPREPEICPHIAQLFAAAEFAGITTKEIKEEKCFCGWFVIPRRRAELMPERLCVRLWLELKREIQIVSRAMKIPTKEELLAIIKQNESYDKETVLLGIRSQSQSIIRRWQSIKPQKAQKSSSLNFQSKLAS